MAHPQAIVFAPDGSPLPDEVSGWLAARGVPVTPIANEGDLMSRALRGRPDVVVFDARTRPAEALRACARLKADSYTAVVPGAVVVAAGEGPVTDALAASADEVIHAGMPAAELRHRLDGMMRRVHRDVHVHPSTRLPGAPEIEAEIARRLATRAAFAVCYADLDHFKEYNDRYSYNEGDRVIRILAKILHDVARGLCPDEGFVGHIGGDDFIFVVPVAAASAIAQEVIAIFDALVPYQYSDQDRSAGYFFGKDRRGQLHRVPLMTVSIGIVTTERRTFASAAHVSELATEMKSYAKTLPGSVFVVDRRQDAVAESPAPVVSR